MKRSSSVSRPRATKAGRVMMRSLPSEKIEAGVGARAVEDVSREAKFTLEGSTGAQSPHAHVLRNIRRAMHELYVQGGFNRRLQARVFAAQDKAARAFAEVNGWRVARRAPHLDYLAKSRVDSRQCWPTHLWPVDHPFAFNKAGRPAAFVTQPYHNGDVGATVREVRAIAESRGLALHVPPALYASIHNPGATLFLVMTKPGVEVQWLPEQQDPCDLKKR